MAKKQRPRTDRRVRERAARELVRDRQKLAALLPGGAPDRPIDVPSAAVIPIRARGTPCPLCDGALHIEHEAAESRGGRLLHATHVACTRCGVARVLWFQVTPGLPS
ncbi:MAG TPA: hypothetical protein VN947_32355 [Polyangia bacterium]|nr:hypothetical protein [Polyangia bacterium]